MPSVGSTRSLEMQPASSIGAGGGGSARASFQSSTGSSGREAIDRRSASRSSGSVTPSASNSGGGNAVSGWVSTAASRNRRWSRSEGSMVVRNPSAAASTGASGELKSVASVGGGSGG